MYVYKGPTANEKYIGGIKNGYRDGYGWYKYEHRTTMHTIVYKGMWKDHNRCGYGVETNGDGTSKYAGNFVANKKHGQGCQMKG